MLYAFASVTNDGKERTSSTGTFFRSLTQQRWNECTAYSLLVLYFFRTENYFAKVTDSELRREESAIQLSVLPKKHKRNVASRAHIMPELLSLGVWRLIL